MDNFYITTSIAYTNAPPHIGFALELVQADVLARYKRKQGFDTRFLTGTDEHGLKIARKAEKEGKEPQEFVDEIAGKYQTLAKDLNISNDDFIRTTDQKRHWPGATAVWKKIEEKGDLYKEKYQGYYCVGCEAFLTEKDLEDGICPHHGKAPEEVEEENYFFKLSKYEDQIRDLISQDEIKVIPEGRKKEILSFLSEGLKDISVSRSNKKLKWGIPVPGDSSQTMYVWIDALSNYISALGYGRKEDEMDTYWPADVHFIGKDILRFHSVIWIGILLSAELEVPKTIFSHGFITSGGQKMSKSIGNVIDPFEYLNDFGSDPLRYYLLSSIPATSDGDFTRDRFLKRYKSDLADGLGNLVSRSIGLAKKKSVAFKKDKKVGGEVRVKIEDTKKEVNRAIENFQFKKGLDEAWNLIHFMDGYIEEKKPWEESWEQEKVISEMLYACYRLQDIIYPFLPETAIEIKRQIESGKRKIIFKK